MKNRSIRILAIAALATGAAVAVPAHADEGPLMVRLRALHIGPANKSDAVPVLGLPKDQLDVSSKWAPDIDFEYYFAKNWSSELLLTVPQKHDVTVKALGGASLGTFKHLPPVLTLKYNFLPDGQFRPYVGIGVNLTLIMNVDLNIPAAVSPTGTVLPVKLDSSSVGPALQAGFDVKLADHWFASADVKYVQIRSDVKVPGVGKVSAVKVDPWLIGIGGGYRF